MQTRSQEGDCHRRPTFANEGKDISMRRGSTIALVLSSLVLLTEPPHVTAAQKPVVESKTPDAAVSRTNAFAFPNEQPAPSSMRGETPREALGSAAPTASPGTAIGNTWYDLQHVGSMGRMVETAFGTNALVHFAWTFLPDPVWVLGELYYNDYDISNSRPGTPTGLQPPDDYGGYAGLTTTGDNRAVVGGQNKSAADGIALPEAWWDFLEGAAYFGNHARLPLTLANLAGGQDGVFWPKFAYVEGPTDTVLHIVALVDGGSDWFRMCYFRRVGSDATPNPTWTSPPYIVDTIYDVSPDIVADNDGKVALVWTANLPCSAADPDTASGFECRTYVQQDNDVYYQMSTDYGVTWQPKVNVTHYIQTEGTDSYRAYTDVSALLDSDGLLHIVWAARAWPANSEIPGEGEAGLYRGRIFHWSEYWPVPTTVHAADWDQTICSPGAWNLTAGKMSISECNGRFYVLFTQINDGPAGVYDDCATTSSPGFPTGAGNGDLYVTVSGDGGITWDYARDITNSRTPGCDSIDGLGGPCDNDNWPSMPRFGTNYALNAGDNFTDVVVPSGGTDNGWYLDVMYVNDHSAGAIVQDEGFWQLDDMRWFRLACVAPTSQPVLVMSPSSCYFSMIQCQSRTRSILLENTGNTDLTYSYTVEEDPGPYSGWLTVSGFQGYIPFGVSHSAEGTIRINESGAVCSPGQYTYLGGRIIFESNSPTSPDTLEVVAWLTPENSECWPDTVSTTCLSLLVDQYAAEGGQGKGRVNMDYVNSGDCDTTADVYLYDGSPVVGWVDGTDTVMNWSIFGNNFNSPVGFWPTDCNSVVDGPGYQSYTTTVLARDTSLVLEKTWYAPTDPAYCHFIIQQLRVWSGDGLAHGGVTIGEAVDWDVPSDSMSNRNGSGLGPGIYQFGAEYHQDDTTACQDSDRRYAGVMFVKQFVKGMVWTKLDDAYGAYTADNATYVYGNTYGFDPGQLYAKMQQPGYSTYSSTSPDSQYVDLHTVMTYDAGYTVNVGETLIVYTALITGKDGYADFAASTQSAVDWCCHNLVPRPPGCTCCTLRGDCDLDGQITVADLGCFVVGLFQNGWGYNEHPCPEVLDVDGSGGFPNVADLTYLVRYIFQDGPPPPPCR